MDNEKILFLNDVMLYEGRGKKYLMPIMHTPTILPIGCVVFKVSFFGQTIFIISEWPQRKNDVSMNRIQNL